MADGYKAAIWSSLAGLAAIDVAIWSALAIAVWCRHRAMRATPSAGRS